MAARGVLPGPRTHRDSLDIHLDVHIRHAERVRGSLYRLRHVIHLQGKARMFVHQPKGMRKMTVMEPETSPDIGQDTGLLVVDDDKPFLNRFCRAMEARGFTVRSAESVADGLREIRANPPAYAVIDMRLEDGNGLDVVQTLNEMRPDSRVIVLTGYGNITTAVAAVKMGAVDYLAKPADADDVYAALMATQESHAPPPENPMSADRVRWEHIQRIYELCDRNVSETARKLNMHRRTLQRILAKRAPK